MCFIIYIKKYIYECKEFYLYTTYIKSTIVVCNVELKAMIFMISSSILEVLYKILVSGSKEDYFSSCRC